MGISGMLQYCTSFYIFPERNETRRRGCRTLRSGDAFWGFFWKVSCADFRTVTSLMNGNEMRTKCEPETGICLREIRPFVELWSL